MEENSISVAESQEQPGLDESSPTCSRVPPGDSLTPLGAGVCICAMLTRPFWRASVSPQELPLSCGECSGYNQALASAGD